MAKKQTTLDYFSAAFVQKQRKRLEDKLVKLQAKQKDLTTYPDFGNSLDDSAQETAEYENNLSLKSNVDAEVKAVRKALKRIENGTYGICKKTHLPIEKGRLEVLPEAEYSADAEPKK